jgi:hypothetical protein
MPQRTNAILPDSLAARLGASKNGDAKKKERGLCGRDLENLRGSGLTDETIRENGLYTAYDSSELASILHRGRQSNCCLGGLVFPYRDMEGELNSFARVRPHHPRTREGEPIKYEQPVGESNRAYYPMASLPKLRDGESAIFITEGEKKALALSQLDRAAVGICGIWSWKPKDAEKLIDGLAVISWEGRQAYVVFDYDRKEETRHQARQAAERLAKLLYQAGASQVRWVALPAGPDGAKQGVDDLLASDGGPDRFLDALTEAELLPSGEAGAAVIPIIKIISLAPPTLSGAAYHGLAGDFLRAVAPYTEATDAGVLGHLLPAVGTLAGPRLRVWAGGWQYPRVNVAVVGPTSRGRKGTSFAPVNVLMEMVTPAFWRQQYASGLSSGEGLIVKVADIREKNAETGEWEETPVEKRLYVRESEFSSVLAHMRREGNVLSHVIRDAYDGEYLATLTVNPRQAAGAHISIVVHITPEELRAKFHGLEMANGFGNRFLWLAVKSDKILPHTQPIPDEAFAPFLSQLKALSLFGTTTTQDRKVRLNSGAGDLWESVYPQLTQDRPYLADKITARGESIVIRLALIYAILDCPLRRDKLVGHVLDLRGFAVHAHHLEAALGVWDYAVQSARLLFPAQTGNDLADQLLALLDNGAMTRHEFNKHLSVKRKADVDAVLARLEEARLVRRTKLAHKGAGRPAERWERT